MNWDRLNELTQIPGASGYEFLVKKAMHKYISEYTEEIVQDRLGGIFGVKTGDAKGPRVMVAGHMDEVGFMITRITENGFLRFRPLGGWWTHVLLSQQVEIVTRQGKRIRGVIGSTPVHLLTEEKRKKLVDTDQMFIDIGAQSVSEVREWGIEIGDFAVPFSRCVEIAKGRRLLSKAWDNRFGCAMALELLDALQTENHPNVVYSGATVQEEVGLRGALAASNTINPDVFFAVDTGPAGDTPDIQNGYGRIGKGVLIRIYDRSMVLLPTMRDFLLDTAETQKIPYQFFVSNGGTDAGAVHTSGRGVPSAGIGICARYIHSHAAIVDKEDIEAAKEFIVSLVRNLNSSAYKSILGEIK